MINRFSPIALMFADEPQNPLTNSYWSQSASGTSWVANTSTLMYDVTMPSPYVDTKILIRAQLLLVGTSYFFQPLFTVAGGSTPLNVFKVKIVAFTNAAFTTSVILFTLDSDTDLSKLLLITPTVKYYGLGMYVDYASGYGDSSTVVVSWQGGNLFQVLPSDVNYDENKYKFTQEDLQGYILTMKSALSRLTLLGLTKLQQGYPESIENSSNIRILTRSIFALSDYSVYSSTNFITNKQAQEAIEDGMTIAITSDEVLPGDGYLIDPGGRYIIDSLDGKILSL